jgi:hypothetical protein
MPPLHFTDAVTGPNEIDGKRESIKNVHYAFFFNLEGDAILAIQHIFS